ncbi:hypothetical protein [Thermoflavimicrobium daqui]|uniref:Uncharacterized protein n=1 Tax=Thermoflavimicrobium daqui TaxID=2137476 RepID=A0A364K3Y6_9BACL|nr:hypothetical protein [Thermoflavimicrobium daqui]RAL24075.1 hypothetical protein DL897_10285 [Thermoflavimicrobium daqui]
MKKFVMLLTSMLCTFVFSLLAYAESSSIQMKKGQDQLVSGKVHIKNGKTLRLLVDYQNGSNFRWEIRGDSGFVLAGNKADANLFLGVPSGNYQLHFYCKSKNCTATGEISNQ